jgi:phosphoglycerate dehydrogenase-like enzyme
VKNCQTEVSTTIKKWDDQIKQAKKVTANENEKIDKEVLHKQDVAYKTIHAWRADYDKIELQPLRAYIAEIVKAKKSLHKFLKEVILAYLLLLTVFLGRFG